jgi:hypothetical protein
MMPLLHDDATRAALKARLTALRPDSQRQWGKMSVDQMLWHVNAALNMALGRSNAPPDKLPLPLPIMRFLVIHLPWPKNGPTNPTLIPQGQYDFETEHALTPQLMDELAQRDIRGDWGNHPLLGHMSGRQVSKLQAKHLDHHLRQFGV